MVVAQPYVPTSALTPAEPYQFTVHTRPPQLAVIDRTLAVARGRYHGLDRTHFTVLPEYSIPGLEGIALIDGALQAADWPTQTVLLGGTDALTQNQYRELIQAEGTTVDASCNGADAVGPARWVNCAITWVKDAQGIVRRWVQPKLHPAWLELDVSHQHMFCGRSVFVFRGQLGNGVPFRFCSLVCFDWITLIENRTPCQWVLQALHAEANGHQLPMSWVFVIQNNQKPSHDTFLSGVAPFFDQTIFPNALRDRACLVFANTAGLGRPGRSTEFGTTSLVLSPQSLFKQPTCAPTFSTGGARFRDGSNLLAPYKDVVFRERGACIHSFTQVNAGSIVAGPAGRTIAVDQAHVFSTTGVAEPRAPGGEVPASVKWLNDELDAVPSLSAGHPGVHLAAQSDGAQQLMVSALRSCDSHSATQAVTLAAQGSVATDADHWQNLETEALHHLVHTLAIVGVALPGAVVGPDQSHAAVSVNGQSVHLLAVRGESHEKCVEHSKASIQYPRRQILLVSRDPDNTAWQARFGSFLETERFPFGGDRRITDASGVSTHIGYQNLLTTFRTSVTVADLQARINAELAA